MTKTEPTWYASIWIAGYYDVALRACREFCDIGLCVTVTQTMFVYTGGQEEGVCVRLIHYPRFPSSLESREKLAADLAEYLRMKLQQQSYTIEMPDRTVWVSYRPEDNK